MFVPVTTLGILVMKLLTVLMGTPSVSSWMRVMISSICKGRLTKRTGRGTQTDRKEKKLLKWRGKILFYIFYICHLSHCSMSAAFRFVIRIKSFACDHASFVALFFQSTQETCNYTTINHLNIFSFREGNAGSARLTSAYEDNTSIMQSF